MVRLKVATRPGRRPRPEVRAISIEAAEGAEEVSATLVRTIKVEQLLANAVDAARYSSESGTWEHWGLDNASKGGLARGRRQRMSDETVRTFVREYRALTGTMEERAEAMSYSRSSVYRFRDEARERGIIGKDEDL